MEVLSQPKVTFFAYYNEKTSVVSEKKIYDCYVLFAIKSGKLQYQIEEDQLYTAAKNSIVIFPPNTPVSLRILEPAAFVMAKLEAQAHPEFSQEPFVTEGSRIAENISELSKNGFAFTHSPDDETIHYILDLWYLPTNAMQRKKAPLQEAYDYLCSHFCEDISIQSLAESYGYTPPRFIAIFNKHYKAPPKNIILQNRILKAQQLLLQTDLSVAEISLACGYEDALYFSRIFSKYCGVSPAQFRKAENV